MSYLILGLGALLSLGGAWTIFASYGIIQVERGWAGVIAGTTALSCGIVTIGIGLILHRLAGLHVFLKNEKSLILLPQESAAADDVAAAREDYPRAFGFETSVLPEAVQPPAAASPAPSAASSKSWLERTPRPDFTPGQILKTGRGAASAPAAETPDSESGLKRFSRFSLGAGRAPAASPVPPPDVTGPSDVEIARAVEETEKPRHVAREWEMPSEPVRPEPPHEPEIEAPRLDVEHGFDDPLAQPEFQMTWPPETAHITAISIEQILRGSDFSQNPQSARNEPAEGPEAAGRDAPPPDDIEALYSEPQETSPDTELPASPDERRTIVGQYESAGTAYVMYADGSIEARSERGVLHFDSMAELKAFMDRQS
jgi:hypothetical protein